MAAAERRKLPVLRITQRELEKRCKRLEDSSLSPTVQRSSSSDLLDDSSTESKGSSAATSDWCKDAPSRSRPAGTGSKSGGGLLHIKPITSQKEKKRHRRGSNSSSERKRRVDDQRESDEYTREVPQATINSATKSSASKLWSSSEKSKESSESRRLPVREEDANKHKKSGKELSVKGKEPSEKDRCLAEWKRYSDGKIKHMLARWTGDTVKLQQVFQMWLVSSMT